MNRKRLDRLEANNLPAGRLLVITERELLEREISQAGKEAELKVTPLDSVVFIKHYGAVEII